MKKRISVWLIAAGVAACADSSGGGTGGAEVSNGSTGGGGAGGSGLMGRGGTGAGPNLDKDPSTVTDPDECWFEGGGGAITRGCTAATIELSESIPLDELTVSIEASDGTTFEAVVLDAVPTQIVPDEPTFYARDPATTLFLRNNPGGASSNEHYAPEWLDVEVRRNDVLVGAERFEPLEYACYEASRYHFCWESTPVTLEITNPEAD